MRIERIKNLLCVLCLGLPVVFGTVAAAQSDTSSVLDRVQNVDDPELGELLRVTMEKQGRLTEKEKLEIIRKVTISYVQIKLLDRQIAEVSRKIAAETGPAEMQYELLMAKTELESKLTGELANLREIMGIVPRHAFEEQQVDDLSTWLSLEIIDDRVCVLDALEPFSGYWAVRRWESAGLLSTEQTLDHVRERLTQRSNLPIRIDIYYVPATKAASEDLRADIISLARETDSQMDTDVRLELSVWVGSGKSPFFLRKGKIRTMYPCPVTRPDKGPKPLVTGLVNPNDIEQSILWRLTMPKNLPLTFQIEYDEESALLAKQIADTARTVAKRIGAAEVVEIVETLVEPVPEARFLGRWQAVADSVIQEIEFQPGGQSILTMKTGSQREIPAPWMLGTKEKTGSQREIPAPWMLGTKEIFIDSEYLITYRGYINTEGNLVIDRGGIWPQGSWHDKGQPEMVFRKVE